MIESCSRQLGLAETLVEIPNFIVFKNEKAFMRMVLNL